MCTYTITGEYQCFPLPSTTPPVIPMPINSHEDFTLYNNTYSKTKCSNPTLVDDNDSVLYSRTKCGNPSGNPSGNPNLVDDSPSPRSSASESPRSSTSHSNNQDMKSIQLCPCNQ